MSWRAISEDDVLASLNDTLGTAMRTYLTKSGQTDPLTQSIELVTAEVREAVRSNPRNREHATTTFVPVAAIRHAVALIRMNLAQRIPLGLEISESWEKAAATAQEYLSHLAAGRLAVANPDGSAAASRTGTWNSENQIVGRMHPTPRPGHQFPSDSEDFANDANDE